MEFVFLRHGKAQARETGLADEDRRLTGKGRKRVRDVARSLKCGLIDLRDVRIWSSPVRRAKETAEIVAKVLKVEKVQYHPAIASGDLNEWMRDLQELPDKASLLIVGHEPYLGRWVNRITGAEVSLFTASVAAVKMTSLEPPKGRLRWFASSGLLADIAEENG
jgi:phosphohistidine phosphatase